MTGKGTAVASYSGSAVSVIASLTLTEWGIIFGILTAIGTFILNAYFQRRKDFRDQEWHALRMEDRRKRNVPVSNDRRHQSGEDSREPIE